MSFLELWLDFVDDDVDTSAFWTEKADADAEAAFVEKATEFLDGDTLNA